MKLINRLKIFEQKYVFLRWATGAEYGKITYVGEDYVEFNIIDVDTMEYRETVIFNSSLILNKRTETFFTEIPTIAAISS